MRDNLSNGLLHGYISSFLCRFITLSCIISNDSLFSGREKERGETEGKSKMNPAGFIRGGGAGGRSQRGTTEFHRDVRRVHHIFDIDLGGSSLILFFASFFFSGNVARSCF
jgi:hypothetical protein